MAVPVRLRGGHASCDTTVHGYQVHFEAPVTRTAEGVRLAGSWSMNLRGGFLRMSGTFALSKPLDQNTVIELLYPTGRSPKVFVQGWVFGARCTVNAKESQPEDKSEEVVWSGTASFQPEKGRTSRPRFQGPGPNKITLTCGQSKRTFPVHAISTAGFARLGDKAQVPADGHGCPACPHPAVGPFISGSPSITVDGRPAARVGDVGVHAACCGPNTWRVTSGSPEVLIDGRPAAMIGSTTEHCGGIGRVIEGSPGSAESGAGRRQTTASVTSPAAPTTSLPAAPPPEATPIVDAKGSEKTQIRTGPAETRVLRNSVAEAAPRSATSVLPDSQLLRRVDGMLELLQGAALVTTLGPGAQESIHTSAGKIELGSQARIVRLGNEVDVAMLTGKARITPRSGAPFEVAEGASVRFDRSGRKTITALRVEDYPRAFGSYLDPSHPREPAVSSSGVLAALAAVPRWAYLATAGLLAIFVTAVAGVLAWALLRKPLSPARRSNR